ncbi:LacI family DNA-binding transcriptional regulator [Pseudarthrobacter sp. H2]|uniref:LacI family DNA-binding transcriptional regulator n=1 Tax=Pseudarthrobacter sp. H2 TaxID=3418415 RepID=UPI003CF31EF4
MPENRLPTIIDVARHAGVSKSVVSRVLSGNGAASPAARAQVLVSAHELGYRVNVAAQTLVSGRTRTVGVLLRRSTSPFYAQLMSELQSAANLDDYRMVAVTGNLDEASEQRALETLLELRVGGLVIGSGTLPNEAIAAVAARLPSVAIGRDAPGTGADVVRFDAERTALEAVRLLSATGHRRILLFDSTSSYSALPRRTAFLDAAAAAGIRTDLVETGYDFGPSLQAASEAIPRLCGPGAATAVVALSQEAALAAVAAAESSGLAVPAALTVLALDMNESVVPLRWDLTGYVTDVRGIARLTWAALTRRFADPAAAPETRLAPLSFHAGATAGTAVS